MATATTTNYHSVSICEDLPQAKKYYSSETFIDLPPDEYWIRKMDDSAKKEHYKVQHVMVNGPCK